MSTCCICYEKSLTLEDLAINHPGHAVCHNCFPLLAKYPKCPFCQLNETLKSEHEAWKSTKDSPDTKLH